MRARTVRLVVATVAVCLLGMSMGAGAAASASEDPTPSLLVEVLDTQAHGLDQLIALAGAPHRIEVTARVTNAGSRVERDVVVRVETPSSAAGTMPFDLAPGQAVTSIVAVRSSGMPGGTREILVSAGGTRVGADHAEVPWLLVVAGVLGLHVAALGVRDRLRAKVARAEASVGGQPSPSQTWARSSRYSETS